LYSEAKAKVKSAIEEFKTKCDVGKKENLQRVLDINPQAINYLSQHIEEVFASDKLINDRTKEIINETFDLNCLEGSISQYLFNYFIDNLSKDKNYTLASNCFNHNVSLETLVGYEADEVSKYRSYLDNTIPSLESYNYSISSRLYEKSKLTLEFYTWLFELEKPVEGELVMIDIDKIASWLECLKYPKGQMMNLRTNEVYEFTYSDIKAAYDYWNDEFKRTRESINGTNEAKDRFNKHFYSQAVMVLSYLNRSGKGNYQLVID
jgi:hypothetical protein